MCCCHFRLEFGRTSVVQVACRIFSFSVRVIMPFSLAVQLDRPGRVIREFRKVQSGKRSHDDVLTRQSSDAP